MPGRGFLLNNELTDFYFTPVTPAVPDPNLPAAGKRPRSSHLADDRARRHGRPFFATRLARRRDDHHDRAADVINRLDRDMPLVEAIAAPRATQRNAARTELEPALYDSPLRGRLEALGHSFSLNPEIGAATGVQRLPDGRWLAAAEKVRRGGGSALVVHPSGKQ